MNGFLYSIFEINGYVAGERRVGSRDVSATPAHWYHERRLENFPALVKVLKR